LGVTKIIAKLVVRFSISVGGDCARPMIEMTHPWTTRTKPAMRAL
jgi:hypothetical protein